MSDPTANAAPVRTLLGIDTGGTFTDFVCRDARGLRVHKVLSTPRDPVEAIRRGVAALEVDLAGALVVHGSTVATNAILEGEGARTVFVTNRGLGDVLTIARQARPALYDLRPAAPPVPVPPELCLETGGRLGADGAVVEPLTGADRAALAGALARLRPEAVAISLLFSFLDDRFERAIAELVPEGVFVSRSAAVLAEYREYERGIATWLNARVGPLMQGYLSRLETALAPATVAIMQSTGLTCGAGQAGAQGVHLLLSGPAGGLRGAAFAGARAGESRLLSFDMGGTSTDVAAIDGDIALTTEGRVAGYPVGVPMVDMHTIGAGGGSIAQRDPGGLLQVGPRSAGAVPGPACYGQGGAQATVTDANLVLGRLPGDVRLGGAMALDRAAAEAALGRLAEALDLPDPQSAALGVVRVVNEHMAQALRVISVQRGLDPRAFVLTSFGGAGGLHICDLAEALGMTRALVPDRAGVLSALGMLAAPPGRELSRTVGERLDTVADATIARVADELTRRGMAELAREGIPARDVEVLPSADLCYAGQSFALNVPWTDGAAAARRFHAAHEARYGHRLGGPLELVNLRVRLRAAPPDLAPPAHRAAAGPPAGETAVWGIERAVPVRARASLAAGETLPGPAVVVDPVATTWIAPGWAAGVDRWGALALERVDATGAVR